MKATGLIVEYNPFHNGHKFHISATKSATNADVIIAVMSGNFLQRGEPAFVDKWARTKIALLNGVDIVFELPYTFATAHAPTFAKGAIQLLEAAQASAFCFGSEAGDIHPFENSIELHTQIGDTHEQLIKEAMQRGISYPQALNKAYSHAVQSQTQYEHYADLSKPNNILGFHYMQAARDINSTMQAATIQRVGAQYHDDTIAGHAIASATGIRKSFFDTNNLHDAQTFLPDTAQLTLSEWQATGQRFGHWEAFYPLLRFTILREGPKRLNGIADISEGIENLFYRAAMSSDTFAIFMGKVKSKRYTWTRIQRMLTHILTGFTYDQRQEISSPSYLRLLGMTQTGRLYLNEHKKDFTLPLVSKVAAFSDPALELDIHAANTYALGTSGKLGTDYQHAPIFIR